MPFLNGQVPYSVVSVVLATGWDSNGYWEFRCTPAFAARWAFAKRWAEEHYGKTIFIRPGWNIYRPLFSQQIARTNACNQGNCKGAAVPGSSSHGGEWQGHPCLAVDVDPNGLSWDQVDKAMEAAGFSARLITEAMSGIKGGERWHYILFSAYDAVPASMNVTPITPTKTEDPEEESNMNVVLYLYIPTNTLLLVDHMAKTIRSLGASPTDPVRGYFAEKPYIEAFDAGTDGATLAREKGVIWQDVTPGYAYIVDPDVAGIAAIDAKSLAAELAAQGIGGVTIAQLDAAFSRLVLGYKAAS